VADIAVVGAGIAGSSLARVLRERGHQVTVVAAPGDPHSLAATAVLRRAWHQGGERQLFDASMAAYARWGVHVEHGALVTSWARPGEEPRRERDWAAIDPAAPMVAPDAAGYVTAVTGTRVELDGGPVIGADAVAVCAGAGPLSPPGKITWGITWTHPDPAAALPAGPAGLRVHHLAPYKTLFAGRFARAGVRSARLGSSSGPHLGAARRGAEDQLGRAIQLGIARTAAGWRPVAGARHHGGPALSRRAGVWYLAGLARTGYALAPGRAGQLAGRIEQALHEGEQAA
jgi:hypothetical protein